MLAQIKSVALSGIEAVPINIEVDISIGLPGLRIVGLVDKAVQEAGDRVRSALKNLGYEFPNRKIIVNMAPAELRKEGSGFDLAIAVGILIASNQLVVGKDCDYLLFGELALDGTLRPIKGALAATITAQQIGMKGVIVPFDNVLEAKAISSIEIIGVKSLFEAVEFIKGNFYPDLKLLATKEQNKLEELCYSDIRGQEHVKRAMMIVAAGAHHCLLMGPPGSGKTMAAKRLPSILPKLTFSESLETSKIYSIAGELLAGEGLLVDRTFRSPHHNISAPGLIGGGSLPRPGEISLAHNGVLFLDEAPEFTRSALETLRQPLEEGKITISRAAGIETFPANFILVMSMNLCPCGKRGDKKEVCRCSPKQISNYVNKISGPLLDRIDLYVSVPAVAHSLLFAPRSGDTSTVLQEKVLQARERQYERYKHQNILVNSAMSEQDIEKFCQITDSGKKLLQHVLDEYGLSARAYTRILKVARTIADLESEEKIFEEHLLEAVQYRLPILSN